jgi:hypothetical protein
MGLPTGEVGLHEVLEWAEEQAPFLRSPATRLVLIYLCTHTWRVPENPEKRNVGDVLSRYASVARIQRGTGLSDKTVRGALRELQSEGYIIANLKHGNGKSEIGVFWEEGHDEFRADYRAGIKPLPKPFRRGSRTPQPEPPTDNVVNIRSGKNYRNPR